MSFPRYAEYKDSGVEWLGEVPGHWDLRRLGFYFKERREKVSDADYEALSVTKSGVVPQLETAAKTDDGDNRKKVCAGDFVINGRSDRKGSSGLSALAGSVSLINIVLEPQESIHPGFTHQLLRSVPFQEEFYRFGKGIVADLWSTNYSEMRNILLAVPPRQEQEAIGSFLNHETAKIDALVAEQEKLIALLKEKRQAVISHAVTKGLNPNAPMKDSGIEWVGEVPAHWEVVALGRITKEKCDGPFGSGIKSDHYTDSGALVVRLQNIRATGFYNGEPAYLDIGYFENDLLRHSVEAGDLLIAGLGDDNNLVGRACVAPTGIAPALVKADCFRFRLDTDRAKPDFVATQLCISAGYDSGHLATGSTRSRIPLSQMATRRLVLPPIDEQFRISQVVWNECSRFDKLVAETERATLLLKERRSALISAAVTGKIDVREFAAEREAA